MVTMRPRCPVAAEGMPACACRGYRSRVSTNTRLMDATPEQVWKVLSDGWLYPLWVVGATRMRDVDEGWPAVGTRLHHSVGSWPLMLDDTTEVLESARARCSG